jgi:small subunit ribosomal protein S2
MPSVSMRQLLEAGVHFGHQTRRWNPKMRPYIFAERNGIHIIDLAQTVKRLDLALEFVRETAARGETILFVGTKKQAQDVVAEQAGRVGMPFVNTRWLGGMLTNFQTISRRLQRLRELREMQRSGAFEYLPKKEVLKLRHEKEKLERNLGGIQDLERLPDAIFVIDTKKEHIAVTEARKLGLPVIAIVDTNCDPDEVDYVIPGNDDAIRAVALISRVVADAIEDGRNEGWRQFAVRSVGLAEETPVDGQGDGPAAPRVPPQPEVAPEPQPEVAPEPQPEVAPEPQVAPEPVEAEGAAAPGDVATDTAPDVAPEGAGAEPAREAAPHPEPAPSGVGAASPDAPARGQPAESVTDAVGADAEQAGGGSSGEVAIGFTPEGESESAGDVDGHPEDRP